MPLPQRSVFPGQPLADVLCEVLMADCMKDARRALEAGGMALRLPAHERDSIVSVLADDCLPDTVPLLDAAFAHDGIIMLVMHVGALRCVEPW